MHIHRQFYQSLKVGVIVTALAGVSLSGCTTSIGGNRDEGIGYRHKRHSEFEAMRNWRTCRDEALKLDNQARAHAEVARYLASAKLLEKCESDVGPGAASVNSEERMRAYALAIQNYLKGGDVTRARKSLEAFKKKHPNKDLYYTNGASFMATFEILLGLKDRKAVDQFATNNATGSLKDELRRTIYWKNH